MHVGFVETGDDHTIAEVDMLGGGKPLCKLGGGPAGHDPLADGDGRLDRRTGQSNDPARSEEQAGVFEHLPANVAWPPNPELGKGAGLRTVKGERVARLFLGGRPAGGARHASAGVSPPLPQPVRLCVFD